MKTLDLSRHERSCCPYPQFEKCRGCTCWKRCLFNCLPEAAKRRFKIQRRIYGLSPKELVYREGDEPTGFFVLCAGRLRLYKRNEHGRQLTLSYVYCGEPFGAAAYLTGTRYRVCAEAVEDSVVCWAPKALIESSLRTNAMFMDRLAVHLSRRLVGMRERAKSWGLQSADARLAEFLLAPPPGLEAPPCRLDGAGLNRTEISRCVGLARETVVRTLRSFQQRGLIRVDGKEIVILDRPRLERVLIES